jgi:hypothetical protein
MVSTDPILRCFIDPEGLSYEDLLEGIIPKLGELANGLRLKTEVPSQDLVEPGSPFDEWELASACAPT